MARQQKDRFATRVREIVQSRAGSVIGEEFEEGVVTSASLAVPNNWHNIDMPSAERGKRGIPLDYTDPTGGYTDEQKTDWNRQREQYMFGEFNRQLGPDDSALIICGSEHIEGLTRLLAGAGHDLAPPEDVTKADWFDPPL